MQIQTRRDDTPSRRQHGRRCIEALITGSREVKFPSSAEDQTELCVELSVEPSQTQPSCCSSNVLVPPVSSSHIMQEMAIVLWVFSSLLDVLLKCFLILLLKSHLCFPKVNTFSFNVSCC